MEIRTKREMYSLQQRGLLGNYLQTYTWREFNLVKPKGTFGFRHRTRSGSPLFRKGMDEVEVHRYIRDMLADKVIGEQDVVVSVDTSLVEGRRTLQGEVMRSVSGHGLGLTLCYSQLFSQWTCREEMRQPKLITKHGLEADAMLKQFLDERSYDWMRELCDMYPEAVTEFTSFDCRVGSFGWNTLFWEVRNY
ncbi:MAG: hypothetical protein E6Q97_26625 [Desulfurellales bacterium]|nr:MAG: hypothetical protein E6Q97_26625 [Desulfurellales bacterium]